MEKHYWDFHWYLENMGNSFIETVTSTRLAEFMFYKESWQLNSGPFCFKSTQLSSKIDWDSYLEDVNPCGCGQCEFCNN